VMHHVLTGAGGYQHERRYTATSLEMALSE
jgi:hypothetical protein